MVTWITAHLRLTLLVVAAALSLAIAGGLYAKGRHDAAAEAARRTAVQQAAVASLETKGAQQTALRTAAAATQRENAAAIVAQVAAKAHTSEDSNVPLPADRAARLRDADRQLCLSDPELGCAADPDAG